MNKNILFSPLFLLFTLTLFTACDKKNDPNLTNTDILVAEVWKGDQVLANKIDVSHRQEVIDKVGHIKTARIKFNRDGTYFATYENNEGTQTETGNWEFNDDETKISFDLYGEANVVRLTNRNLEFMAKLPYQGATFDAEVFFVR